MTNTITIGTLIKNTYRQLATSSKMPPRSGPIALPLEKAADHSASARRLSERFWKMWRIMPSVDGMRVAPPSPWRERPTISMSGDVLKPDKTEAAPKRAEPHIKRRSRPKLSPNLPITMSRHASTNEYESTIHRSSFADGWRSCEMPGSEMLRTVTSILIRKTGNRTTARAAQRALHDISIHRL